MKTPCLRRSLCPCSGCFPLVPAGAHPTPGKSRLTPGPRLPLEEAPGRIRVTCPNPRQTWGRKKGWRAGVGQGRVAGRRFLPFKRKKAGRRSWLSLKERKQQVGLFLLDQKCRGIHFLFTIQPSVRPSVRPIVQASSIHSDWKLTVSWAPWGRWRGDRKRESCPKVLSTLRS